MVNVSDECFILGQLFYFENINEGRENIYRSPVFDFDLLKDNSTMDKAEAQIVSYGILYLNPSSHQCQPSYKKYIAV